MQRSNHVLVIDFGAQYAQLIARRIRQAHVYSEIVPSTLSVDEILARNPRAIILSGGPSSVYEPGAPKIDPKLFEHDIPVFGICYGFQAMAEALGGEVAQTGTSEFGRAHFTADTTSHLFAGLDSQFDVWMSHGDSVIQAPANFHVIGNTAHTPVAAFENESGLLSGVQFHPEVLHTAFGQEILRRWLIDIVKCKPTWTSENIIENEIINIKSQVQNKSIICGLSGGVDSAVAAALVQRAVDSQLTCVFVDHGLLREGEAEQVERDFVAATGVNLMVVDAREKFLTALKGVTDPEEKRKVIGREFIRTFEEAAVKISKAQKVEFLVQGTLYPDVVESGGGTGTANIKSHHNVGGLPEDLDFTLVEPLRSLFKDEVREVGAALGLPTPIIWRQPFPGSCFIVFLAVF